MTKQPHSATKLRLSKLFRWLAAVCFVKLCVLCMLLLDVPQFSWTTRESPDASPQTAMERADADKTPAPAATAAAVDKTGLGAPLPQGSAAARLAAQATPQGRESAASAPALPVPVVSAAPPGRRPEERAAFTPAGLPRPAPLEAPLAEPGTEAPALADALLVAGTRPSPAPESGFMDALGLKNLPIPGLGSVQAAHAAALDMPVPQASSAGPSPFAPAAQTSPLNMPGAPEIPADIPRGQGIDGAPLQPRSAQGNAPLPALPQRQSSLPGAPAPSVRSAPSAEDPDTKAQELARQQQDVLVLRQQMDQRLRDIQQAEQKMQDMIREARGLENDKVRRLILTYTQMKPKAAAKALESMDERVAVRILSGMSPKQSGDILTYVNPGKTAKFTEIIARMRLPE